MDKLVLNNSNDGMAAQTLPKIVQGHGELGGCMQMMSCIEFHASTFPLLLLTHVVIVCLTAVQTFYKAV